MGNLRAQKAQPLQSAESARAESTATSICGFCARRKHNHFNLWHLRLHLFQFSDIVVEVSAAVTCEVAVLDDGKLTLRERCLVI